MSGAEDKTVKVWNVGGSWDCIQTIEGHDDYVRVVYGLSSPNKIATGGIKYSFFNYYMYNFNFSKESKIFINFYYLIRN